MWHCILVCFKKLLQFGQQHVWLWLSPSPSSFKYFPHLFFKEDIPAEVYNYVIIEGVYEPNYRIPLFIYMHVAKQ